MTKILIVEDEPSFSEALEFLLGKEGFAVVTAENGSDAIKKFEQGGIDLVLLDLMIPEVSGIDVCRSIRMTSQVPIIMLTAKDAEIDKVVGLELGADDYMPKPFEPRELIARIQSVLRRTKNISKSSTLNFNELTIELNSQKVKLKDDNLDLTTMEFELLKYFDKSEIHLSLR